MRTENGVRALLAAGVQQRLVRPDDLAAAWWADMRRDNDLTISGYLVLRFPAFALREHPELVAAQIANALRRRGQAW